MNSAELRRLGEEACYKAGWTPVEEELKPILEALKQAELRGREQMNLEIKLKEGEPCAYEYGRNDGILYAIKRMLREFSLAATLSIATDRMNAAFTAMKKETEEKL
ncbi:hypothetical protein IID24_03050 [Patescibacteria group bacterium]|nr:hypothetical protein [Patescibacteria group bacterium]